MSNMEMCKMFELNKPKKNATYSLLPYFLSHVGLIGDLRAPLGAAAFVVDPESLAAVAEMVDFLRKPGWVKTEWGLKPVLNQSEALCVVKTFFWSGKWGTGTQRDLHRLVMSSFSRKKILSSSGVWVLMWSDPCLAGGKEAPLEP